jgi:hypothetical protein
MAREVETNPARLRQLAIRAQRLADGTNDAVTRDRLRAAADEYEQRAVEIEMDNGTGQ